MDSGCPQGAEGTEPQGQGAVTALQAAEPQDIRMARPAETLGVDDLIMTPQQPLGDFQDLWKVLGKA